MARELRFAVSAQLGEVSAILERPRDARCLLVLAHGAGAGMRHPFMAATADALARRRVASFRYQFPYMEQGRRGPSPRPALLATVQAAAARAARAARALPLLAGGKSMGGRMSSLAASQGLLPGIRGLVLLGFPLHPAGKPAAAAERSAHLRDVATPMLFLQGTRDELAPLARLRPICRRLGARATLHVVEGGNHSFQVLKRSGRRDDEVIEELADAVGAWSRALRT